MTLGEKIGIYAKQRDISIRKLSDLSNCNYNSLYSFVKRKGIHLPNEQIERISNVLGVPVEQLKSKELIPQHLTDAEQKLQLTINMITQSKSSTEKEQKLLLLNDFIVANKKFLSVYLNDTK